MNKSRILATCAFLCLGTHLRAVDYYVATDGSDSNAGTLLAPFATIQHAATVLSPGDTCYIRGGKLLSEHRNRRPERDFEPPDHLHELQQ
jgi:hypothetical protein